MGASRCAHADDGPRRVSRRVDVPGPGWRCGLQADRAQFRGRDLMTDVAIRADSLSKSYRIDHETKARYRTLRESVTSAIARPFRKSAGKEHETLWALRDVSFEV